MKTKNKNNRFTSNNKDKFIQRYSMIIQDNLLLHDIINVCTKIRIYVMYIQIFTPSNLRKPKFYMNSEVIYSSLIISIKKHLYNYNI